MTSSGEFITAPLVRRAQGSENVSHGCVGMSLKDASGTSARPPGDPVVVTGPPATWKRATAGPTGTKNWAQYQAGSAWPDPAPQQQPTDSVTRLLFALYRDLGD